MLVSTADSVVLDVSSSEDLLSKVVEREVRFVGDPMANFLLNVAIKLVEAFVVWAAVRSWMR